MNISRAMGAGALGNRGFSLVEAMVATAILGLVVGTLGTGMTLAFAVSELNTENLRAIQVLNEKLDLIRACTWNQVTNSYDFIPRTFTAPFYSTGTASEAAPFFDGTITIAAAPVTESYGRNLKQVTVRVTWTSANVLRSRSMTTLVSPYGIQNYSF